MGYPLGGEVQGERPEDWGAKPGAGGCSRGPGIGLDVRARQRRGWAMDLRIGGLSQGPAGAAEGLGHGPAGVQPGWGWYVQRVADT